MSILHRLRALAATNPVDSVSMDIPLLIRLLEWAREDAGSDVPLHIVAERILNAFQGQPLTMQDYDNIVPQPAEKAGVRFDLSRIRGEVREDELPWSGIADYNAEHKITLETRGDFDWTGMLRTLALLGNWGSSRNVEIAPGDKETQQQLQEKGFSSRFNFDGDGADKILLATVDDAKIWPPDERSE